MNIGYAFVELIEYNNIIYKNIKAANTWNQMYHVIYDSTLSKQKKYDKLRDILMKGGEQNVKIIISIVLFINMIYIIYLDIKVHELEEKLHQERLDSIKELNKLRKKD